MGTRFIVPLGLAVALCAATGAQAQQAQQKSQRAFQIDGQFFTVDGNGNLVPVATLTQDQITDPFALATREQIRLQLQERQRLNTNGNLNGNLNLNGNPRGAFNTNLNGASQLGFMQQRQALMAAQQGQAEKLAVLQRQAGMQAAMARFRHQFAGANVNPLVQTMFTQGTMNQFRAAAFPAQTMDRALIEQQMAAQAMFNVSQAQARAMFGGLSSGPDMATSNVATLPFNNGLNNGFNTSNSANTFNGNFRNGNAITGAGNGTFVTGFNNGFNGVVTPNTAVGFNTGVGVNGFNAFNSGFNTGLNSFNSLNNRFTGFTTISGAGNFNGGFNNGFGGGFNNGFGGGFGNGFRSQRSFNSSQTAATSHSFR